MEQSKYNFSVQSLERLDSNLTIDVNTLKNIVRLSNNLEMLLSSPSVLTTLPRSLVMCTEAISYAYRR